MSSSDSDDDEDFDEDFAYHNGKVASPPGIVDPWAPKWLLCIFSIHYWYILQQTGCEKMWNYKKDVIFHLFETKSLY